MASLDRVGGVRSAGPPSLDAGAPLLPVPRHILSTSGSDTNLLDEWGIPRIRHLVQADGAVSIPPLPPRIATIVVSRWNRLQKLLEVQV